MTLKIDFNAPVTLSFIGLSLVVLLINTVFSSFIPHYFTIGGTITLADPLDFIRLFTHVLGHSSFQHFFSNAILILLLGPILEDKYGSKKLGVIVLITALVTGLVNVLLFSSGLMGASGVVFAFIILASIVNLKSGTIPLTFLLIFTIYIGREVIDIFKYDHISQIAHIVGGLVGAGFGFWTKK